LLITSLLLLSHFIPVLIFSFFAHSLGFKLPFAFFLHFYLFLQGTDLELVDIYWNATYSQQANEAAD